MNIDMSRALPVTIRPLHLETPESYGRRLAQANGLPEQFIAKAARKIAGRSGRMAVREALIEWCESKGNLPPGHFQRQAEQATPGLPSRNMCRLCAYGQSIEQVGHTESYCCLRHRLWAGPGKDPGSQPPINEQVQAAERRYRKLRRSGRAHPALIRELVLIVSRHQGASGYEADLSPENYAAVVDLARLLTNRSFQHNLLTPTRTFAQARRLLEASVTASVPDSGTVLVDGLWRLLRPAFLAVREILESDERPAPVICALLGFDPNRLEGIGDIYRPLEPFSRCVDALKSSLADPWANSCELDLVAGQQAPPRAASKQGDWTAEFICNQGHRSQRTLNTAYGALKQGRSGCPYCAGLRVLAGFNSMAETHPRLASEWHPSFNGPTTPSKVTGAGNSATYWWTCNSGHEWQATPNNRAKGQGCPYCSGRKCQPGVNTLDITHPHIAAEWNPRLNTDMKPTSISAGSGTMVEWICPQGHEYAATVDARTGNRRGCPVCANLRVLPGTNDLATTHPHIAAEWHPSLNSSTTPQAVVAGSSKKYYWRCPSGHDYQSAVSSRTNGKGCPACSGQQVIAGYNDLRTTHPHIAAEWDHGANGSQTPESVIAGSAHTAHWICPLSHRYSKAVNKRVAGSGCKYCSNRKVLRGFNDVTTRHPAIARDWHPHKNEGLSPGDVVPGNARRWWQCADGHEQIGTVPNRIKTGGCTLCPRDRRVQSQY